MTAGHVVLVEDSTQLAGAVARELVGDFGFEVTQVRDVDSLREWLARGEPFDVVVTDLLFEHVNRKFVSAKERGSVTLTSGRLLDSGLSTVTEVRRARPAAGVVIWTSGEQNRRLHLIFAHTELRVRAFCSKTSESGRSDQLCEAISAAWSGASYVDPMLNPYLAPEGAAPIGALLLAEPAKRYIWRAIAFGADTRQRLEQLTGYSARTIGNKIPEMYQDLQALDPGLAPDAKPFIECVRYAASNWEFFVDEAVRQTYP